MELQPENALIVVEHIQQMTGTVIPIITKHRRHPSSRKQLPQKQYRDAPLPEMNAWNRQLQAQPPGSTNTQQYPDLPKQTGKKDTMLFPQ